MKIGAFFPKPRFVAGTLAVGVVLGLVSLLAVHAAEQKQKIEIVISEGGTAKVTSGYSITGVPTEIVIRNEDAVTHGFNSSLFTPKDKVEVTGGSVAEGKGPHVYRVDPGKTMVLKFTPPPKEDSMSYAFWCDMHRATKGEMMVVEYSGSGGG